MVRSTAKGNTETRYGVTASRRIQGRLFNKLSLTSQGPEIGLKFMFNILPETKYQEWKEKFQNTYACDADFLNANTANYLVLSDKNSVSQKIQEVKFPDHIPGRPEYYPEKIVMTVIQVTIDSLKFRGQLFPGNPFAGNTIVLVEDLELRPK